MLVLPTLLKGSGHQLVRDDQIRNVRRRLHVELECHQAASREMNIDRRGSPPPHELFLLKSWVEATSVDTEYQCVLRGGTTAALNPLPIANLSPNSHLTTLTTTGRGKNIHYEDLHS